MKTSISVFAVAVMLFGGFVASMTFSSQQIGKKVSDAEVVNIRGGCNGIMSKECSEAKCGTSTIFYVVSGTAQDPTGDTYCGGDTKTNCAAYWKGGTTCVGG